MGPRFRINSPPVVAETLDGETTIVDLKSGTYYALNQSGSFIWEQLVCGVEPETIATALLERYELDPDEAERAVAELVDELTEQRLIAARSDGVGPEPGGGDGFAAAAVAGAYSPPALSTFTDMQELLLLDPVHEVDESGWPSRS
jgi:hypothetical protein